MADLATLQTSALPRQAETSDPFEARLQELFLQHKEDQQLLAAARQEIEALRVEVARLQAGKGIILAIDGRHFVLKEDVQLLPEANGNGHKKSPLADSFVL